MQLKALIFDVDGTLADTEEVHRLAFNQAFAEHGLTWDWSRPEYARLLKTTGGKERMAAHLATLPLTPAAAAAVTAKIPALHLRKTAIYGELIAQGASPLRHGVARLLDEAAANGVELGIATTTTFENVRVLLETTLGPGAVARFRAIGAGDDVGRKKPAPDVYEFVLQRLNLPADACVAVEDSANGLAAAQAAGLFTVVTPCFWTAAEDLSAADLLVPHLGSESVPLPAPDARRVGGSVVGIAQLDAWMRHGR